MWHWMHYILMCYVLCYAWHMKRKQCLVACGRYYSSTIQYAQMLWCFDTTQLVRRTAFIHLTSSSSTSISLVWLTAPNTTAWTFSTHQFVFFLCSRETDQGGLSAISCCWVFHTRTPFAPLFFLLKTVTTEMRGHGGKGHGADRKAPPSAASHRWPFEGGPNRWSVFFLSQISLHLSIPSCSDSLGWSQRNPLWWETNTQTRRSSLSYRAYWHMWCWLVP